MNQEWERVMENVKEVFDYADFLINVRKNLNKFETCMNNRHFTKAQEHMLKAFADAKLLTHIAGELCERE